VCLEQWLAPTLLLLFAFPDCLSPFLSQSHFFFQSTSNCKKKKKGTSTHPPTSAPGLRTKGLPGCITVSRAAEASSVHSHHILRQHQPMGKEKGAGLAGGQAEMSAGDTPTCLWGRSLCSLPGPAPGAVPMERGAENFQRAY
jgi:hypothetical protein